ncbi:E3 binding domain-containing protein [Halobaculum sp. EA56]|uniref:E3 binding domain-containing protein n=1 Tax=Halobaculum sp. EA56 TaxID=3421648 RepID=UPI003EC0A7E8
MAYVIKMPKLGLEMEQGTVLEWHVDPGDEVAEGDLLAEVESEKSIGEVDAREDGVLRHVYIEEEGSVPPGTPIGILAAPDADIADLRAEAEAELEGEAPEAVSAAAGGSGGSGGAAADSPAAGGDGAAATDGATASTAGDAGTASGAAAGADEVKASPRARERAEELGVDLTTVEGTGFDGAITEEDVENAPEAAETGEPDTSAAADVKASPRARERAEELGVDLASVEGTGFDGAITEEDVEDAAEAAEATAGSAGTGSPPTGATEAGLDVAGGEAAGRYRRETAVVDPAAAEALLGTVEAVRTAFEGAVTTTDVLVVVASAALSDVPVVNGTYEEATHHVRERQDVALVVDGDDGDPITGTVEDAAGRSLGEVVEARQAIEADGTDAESADAAPTFTLANAADASADSRLTNPPAVAALAVDATGRRALPSDEGVDLRPLVTLALTYDARAVGGDEARAFLDAVRDRAAAADELVLASYRGTE